MLNKIKNNLNLISSTLLISIAIVARFLPHPPNFTPLTAIALFAGFAFKDKITGMFVPLLIMFTSDLFIGFHNTLMFVYGTYILISIISRFMLKSEFTFYKLILSGLASSIIFYIVTNFGSWLLYPQTYTRDLSGLFTSYLAAIPFFRNELLANICYSTFLFGAYYFIYNSLLRKVEIKK